MFDTYIQRLGLTFSTSAQCTCIPTDGTYGIMAFRSAISTNPVKHIYFVKKIKNNIQLQHLVEKYSATYFERTTVPFLYGYQSEASKRIGKYLNLAFYVNRLLGIYPDYTLRGVLQRRTSESPYFGMEMNLTF